jgi:hypothetical protein
MPGILFQTSVVALCSVAENCSDAESGLDFAVRSMELWENVEVAVELTDSAAEATWR